MGFAVRTRLYILEDNPVRATELLLASVFVAVRWRDQLRSLRTGLL